MSSSTLSRAKPNNELNKCMKKSSTKSELTLSRPDTLPDRTHYSMCYLTHQTDNVDSASLTGES